jgi:hypothetical protein
MKLQMHEVYLLKRTRTITAAIALLTLAVFSVPEDILAQTAQAKQTTKAAVAKPTRLRREQSFLGIHFDFHAGSDCKDIGARTTARMLDSIIDLVHPDYVQTDCKGHAGYSSYPTKVGNQAPGIIGDPLRLWREVTARRGVALYMHYSGVWDTRAIELHPEWAVIKADSARHKDQTSVFGEYVDKLLVPQLKELAGEYGIDGAWVDGECWATEPDYGERAVRLFREETNLLEIPRSPSEPHWYDWMQFHREAFRRYLRHYLAAVHTEYPEFQICSNWAYTHHQSEPVSAGVDFLSGDYSPNNSVNSARFAGRYLAHQGMPWDLMAWSFSHRPHPTEQKPAAQLKREAAVVLALGGGFQAYYTQNRDGSVRVKELEVMAEVAKFARARQKWCHHSTQIPQVALLQSTENYRRNAGRELFPQYKGAAQGILEALLEAQHSVDLVSEHTLLPDMSRFPLVVVPESAHLKPSFRLDLLNYVRNGGSLLVIGAEASSQFATLAEIALESDKPLVKPLGKGILGFIPCSIGYEYEKTGDAALREKLNSMVKQLFHSPLCEVKGSPYVDVSVSKLQNGNLAVHLVNTSGEHKKAGIIKEITPVGPLQITLRPDAKPAAITLQPSGKTLKFNYSDGTVTLTLDKLEIYDILEITN